jgi:hypothetical protein
MESSPGTVGVEGEQLLTQSKIFKDEVRAGSKNTDQPAEKVSKQHNHGKKSYPMTPAMQFVNQLILRMYEVLTRDKSRGGPQS